VLRVNPRIAKEWAWMPGRVSVAERALALVSQRTRQFRAHDGEEKGVCTLCGMFAAEKGVCFKGALCA